MNRTIAIVSERGGTRKATVSVNVSIGLAKRQLKTLLIELSTPGSTGVQNYKSMIAEVLKRVKT